MLYIPIVWFPNTTRHNRQAVQQRCETESGGPRASKKEGICSNSFAQKTYSKLGFRQVASPEFGMIVSYNYTVPVQYVTLPILLAITPVSTITA